MCTVFNSTLEIARQEVQEVATDDVVLEKCFSIKYNFFNILLCHYIIVLQLKTWLHIVYQYFV